MGGGWWWAERASLNDGVLGFWEEGKAKKGKEKVRDPMMEDLGFVLDAA